jgi:hypothetical protein
MKKIHVVIGLLGIMCNNAWSMEQIKADLFLHNNYGSPIKYVVEHHEKFPEKMLGNGARTESLGDVADISHLFIRTTGYLEKAQVYPYHDLSNELKKIHAGADRPADNKSYDAVITLLPSSLWNAWDVRIDWEPKLVQKVEHFTMDSFEREEQWARKNLGQKYGDAVRKICTANYAQAEKLGFFNLCTRLKKSFKTPRYQTSAKRNLQYLLPDLKPTAQEIKESIDMLSKTLENYLAKGYAQYF